jgi:hypothetical protein
MGRNLEGEDVWGAGGNVGECHSVPQALDRVENFLRGARDAFRSRVGEPVLRNGRLVSGSGLKVK